jgi:hypothetical protein
MKRIRLLVPSVLSALAAAPLLLPAGASAQEFDYFGIFELSNLLTLGEADPRMIAVRLVNASLEFLAIITLVMILWGGFLFLVSGGKDEKMKRAGAVIKNAIIGLIIIMCSWMIVRFVITEVVEAMGADETPVEEVIPGPVPNVPL